MAELAGTAKTIFEKGKAGYAAIYLVSPEDIRAQHEVKSAAKELGRKLFIWTFGKGVLEDGKKNATYQPDTELPPGMLNYLKALPEKSIIVLRLGHHFLDDPLVQSAILDVIPEYKNATQRMLVVQAPITKLPPELEKEIALVEMEYPTADDLMRVLDGIITGSGLKESLVPKDERKLELVEAAKGLTSVEAENALTLSLLRPRLSKDKNAEIWDPQIVMDEKCLALRKTGLVEYIPVDKSGLTSVGGLEHLKEWARKRKNAFSPQARAFGLPEPKGIGVVGPPGTGKSLVAKALSAEFHKPLLKLDVGKMLGSLVGQSEANIRQAIQIAEAVSPCILWIDELEKGFAGASNALDSGVGARILGTFLTWMQEKTSPVFVYATANDVTALPPELLRKGRFDELFSVDLPTPRERKEILAIHLKKRNRTHLVDTGKLDLDHFSGETSAGFTGAEIEAAIVEAMYSSFDAKHDINSFDLQEAFDNTQPLSKTMAEKIQAIRAWCQTRTRPANRIEDPAPPATGRHAAV